jgi:hypothetical protein
MKYFYGFLCLLFLGQSVKAQFSAGLAYGTFRVLGANKDFRGTGPTLLLKYTGGEENQEFFLDASLYNKKFIGSETQIYDADGFSLGYAATKESYSIKHIQLGWKQALGGNFTDTKLNCFLAAGGVVSFIKTSYKYDLSGYKIPDDFVKKIAYGFHFSTGGQWRIKPIVLELRGNFDFVLKPIEVAGGENNTYFLTSLRLGIVVPLIKY